MSLKPHIERILRKNSEEALARWATAISNDQEYIRMKGRRIAVGDVENFLVERRKLEFVDRASGEFEFVERLIGLNNEADLIPHREKLMSLMAKIAVAAEGYLALLGSGFPVPQDAFGRTDWLKNPPLQVRGNAYVLYHLLLERIHGQPRPDYSILNANMLEVKAPVFVEPRHSYESEVKKGGRIGRLWNQVVESRWSLASDVLKGKMTWGYGVSLLGLGAAIIHRSPVPVSALNAVVMGAALATVAVVMSAADKISDERQRGGSSVSRSWPPALMTDRVLEPDLVNSGVQDLRGVESVEVLAALTSGERNRSAGGRGGESIGL